MCPKSYQVTGQLAMSASKVKAMTLKPKDLKADGLFPPAPTFFCTWAKPDPEGFLELNLCIA